MEIKERLIEFIEYKHITKNKLEKDCNLAKRYVSNIGNSMASDVIKKISDKYLDLNVDWLVTGRGEMIYKPSSGGNYAYAIGNGSTNNAVAENNGGDSYTAGSLYIASLREQIEQLKRIVELQDDKIKMMEGGEK